MVVWHQGRIRESSEIRVDLADPVFEHGLGLFETFRSWNDRAPLLTRHLERLARSSAELGLAPLAESDLPTAESVRALLGRAGLADARLRITRTSGSSSLAPKLWLRCDPLVSSASRIAYTLIECPWRIDRRDPLTQYKTLNYWQRRRAFEFAQGQNADEALLFDVNGNPCEGSRANLFLIVGSTLVTPPLSGPIVPGIMRAVVTETARAEGWHVEERNLDAHDFERASEVFLTNSVRGIMPVGQILGSIAWKSAVGEFQSQRLHDRVLCSLGVHP